MPTTVCTARSSVRRTVAAALAGSVLLGVTPVVTSAEAHDHKEKTTKLQPNKKYKLYGRKNR